MFTRKLLAAACGAVAVGLAIPSLTQASYDNSQKTTYLTFNRPVRLPGVALGTGTYIFELPDPEGAWDVVRVSSRDRSRVYFMGFTHIVDRPAGLSRDHIVSFGEARADVTQPITVWWPHDGSRGRQFVYQSGK